MWEQKHSVLDLHVELLAESENSGKCKMLLHLKMKRKLWWITYRRPISTRALDHRAGNRKLLCNMAANRKLKMYWM
ncbi:hypothetical protein GN956_G19114 [Arapaima gigas]